MATRAEKKRQYKIDHKQEINENYYDYSGTTTVNTLFPVIDNTLDKIYLTDKNGNINEITSILIHLTDPNMNKTYQDRFFQGVEFPLDKVIMIIL
jgi:hypothetical protein